MYFFKLKKFNKEKIVTFFKSLKKTEKIKYNSIVSYLIKNPFK